MTYSVSNNCTKNYYNRMLTLQVIVEDVVTWIFLKHSVVLFSLCWAIYNTIQYNIFISDNKVHSYTTTREKQTDINK